MLFNTGCFLVEPWSPPHDGAVPPGSAQTRAALHTFTSMWLASGLGIDNGVNFGTPNDGTEVHHAGESCKTTS